MSLRHEQSLVEKIHISLQSLDISGLKCVHKGRSTSKDSFKGLLTKFFGKHAPEFLVEPDLILVFDDYKEIIDEYIIIGVEFKYFRAEGAVKKKLRQAFRMLGQPLRYLAFGFDSAVLWHVFSHDFNVELAKAYSDLIQEVIDLLELPLVYFSTIIKPDNKFDILVPSEINNTSLEYAIRYLRNLCDDTRNPSINKKTIIERRRVLKVIINLP